MKTTAQQEAEKKKERAVKLGGWSEVLIMAVSSTYDESSTYDGISTYDESSTYDNSNK